MSLYLTSKKTTKGFDGDLIIDTHQSHISHKQFHKITNTILETTVNENKMRWQLQKALSHRDVNNKPMVSGLSLVSSDKFSIEIFDTEPLKGSSYSPTPEKKHPNPTCGLMNIWNDDYECVKMVYETLSSRAKASWWQNHNESLTGQSFKDYHMTFLTRDVLLIADEIENSKKKPARHNTNLL